MNKNKNRAGISLVVLIITIVVGLILIAASIVTIDEVMDEASIGRFVDEMYKIEDSVNSYYLLNNELPIKESIASVNKEYLVNVAKDKEALNQELRLNFDESTDEFYKLDVDAIEYKISKKKQNSGRDNMYFISSITKKIYDLNGAEANNNTYYSITSRLVDVVNLGEETFRDSYIVATEGVSLSASSSNLAWTNNMDVVIKTTGKQSSDTFSLVFDGIGIEKVINSSIKELSFNNLSELNSKGYLTSSLTTTNIQSFNNLSQDKKKIYVVLKRNARVIAKELIDLSNYDPIVPVVGSFTKTIYDNINTLNFIPTDTLSGVKEIRYDYLTKLASDGTTVQYYTGISDFTEDYMRTKAKVKHFDDAQTGRFDIKIPKDVTKIRVAVIDNAGNIVMTTVSL